MTETIVEAKAEEQKIEHPKVEEHKGKFNFTKWLRGSNQKEFVENISFVVIAISAIMISTGIGLGSFIQGTITFAVFGAFFAMIGIVIYIASQFIGG